MQLPAAAGRYRLLSSPRDVVQAEWAGDSAAPALPEPGNTEL